MATLLWFGILVLFLLLESATVAMVSLWFAVGALAAIAAAALGAGVTVQCVVFAVVSCGALALFRPLAGKYITPRITRTNVDSLIGQTCLVTRAIDNVQGTGEVKLGSLPWTARSTDGTPIPAETRVRVDRIEGVKVFVSVIGQGE